MQHSSATPRTFRKKMLSGDELSPPADPLLAPTLPLLPGSSRSEALRSEEARSGRLPRRTKEIVLLSGRLYFPLQIRERVSTRLSPHTWTDLPLLSRRIGCGSFKEPKDPLSGADSG